MSEDPVYLTMEEAAAYLRLPNKRALITCRYRNGVPRGIKQGRRVLFTKAGLDAEMARLQERPAARAARVV